MGTKIKSNAEVAREHSEKIKQHERVKKLEAVTGDTTKVEGDITSAHGDLRRAMNNALAQLNTDTESIVKLAAKFDSQDKSQGEKFSGGGGGVTGR